MLAGGITASFLVGCEREEQNIILSSDYEIIGSENARITFLTPIEQAKDFPLVTLNNLPTITPGQEIDLTKLSQNQQNFPEGRVINNFAFVRNAKNNFLGVVFDFVEGTKFGRLYDTTESSPWPAFIFLINDYSGGIIATSRYTGRKHEEEPHFLKNLWTEFPVIPERITGLEFIIHLNARLLKVDNKELPDFSLPYRFLIKIEPRKNPDQSPEPLPA